MLQRNILPTEGTPALLNRAQNDQAGGGISDVVHSGVAFLRRQYLVVVFTLSLAVTLSIVYLRIVPPTYTAQVQILLGGSRAQFVQQQSLVPDPAIDLSQIEIPRLIVVELGDPKTVDLMLLSKSLEGVKGASLETHAAWRQQLNTMAGTLVISGLLVLALIVLATVLAVVFATRGTMSTNREIVDVLHFIGASNRFIAGEFQGRFLLIGFRGGIVGGLAAILFFVAIALAAGNFAGADVNAELGLLFGRFSIGYDGVAGIAAVVPVIAAMTAITSRLTVRRFLSQIS